jgi:hypothetical protein
MKQTLILSRLLNIRCGGIDASSAVEAHSISFLHLSLTRFLRSEIPESFLVRADEVLE